jgi:hypothetical protein
MTIEDIRNPDKAARNEALFGRYGMDAGGNNELGAWARRFGQPLGDWMSQQIAFARDMEPGRQAAFIAYLRSLRPENIYAMVNAERSRLGAMGDEQGIENAMLVRGMGGGIGAEVGAALRAKNDSVRAGNQMLFNNSSAQGRQAAFNAAAQGYGGAQNPTAAPTFFNTAGLIEGRSSTNAAQRSQRGLNSWLPQLAGFAGQFAGMPMGGGGAGGYQPRIGGAGWEGNPFYH